MSEEAKWGPRIDRPEGGWPNGKCPIPWAKVGEFEVFYGQNEHRRHAPHYPAYFYDWSNITAYRVRADLHRVQAAEPDVVERMSVIDEIAAERRRQVEAEGFTPELDDAVLPGDLALAAASYASHAGKSDRRREDATPLPSWPWRQGDWKPKDRRRDLIRAAALIVAEIERLDRAASKGAGR